MGLSNLRGRRPEQAKNRLTESDDAGEFSMNHVGDFIDRHRSMAAGLAGAALLFIFYLIGKASRLPKR